MIESAPDAEADVCILDTEASPEHLSRGTAQYAETMLVVVEPYYKSLETGRRMALLGKDLGLPHVALLANKIRDERELQAVRQFADQHDLELAGVVPFDQNFPEAERSGRAPLDFAPDSPAVGAIAAIGRQFTVNGRA